MDVNNTKEYSSNSSGNKKTGSVFVVDPNPPGMDIVPPEDLFIYVKFSAYPRSRTTYGGNTLEGKDIFFESGVEDEEIPKIICLFIIFPLLKSLTQIEAAAALFNE
jgi:hypothetical protein